MSDTNINEYYPKEEVPPVTLTAGESLKPQVAAPDKEKEVVNDSLSLEEGVDDLGIDLPDIPLPDDDPIEDSIKDEFDDAAFNFAIVGVGQGGSRLAESFWNL